MPSTTDLLALFAALSATVLGADVYSQFLDSSGAQISSDSFDVGNNGCFTVNGAVDITFSSASPGTADGPYCLEAFTEAGCDTTASKQQFAGVDTTGGTKYVLNSGIANAGSYNWLNEGCPS